MVKRTKGRECSYIVLTFFRGLENGYFGSMLSARELAPIIGVAFPDVRLSPRLLYDDLALGKAALGADVPMDVERYLVCGLIISQLAFGEASPLTAAIRESLVVVERASPLILKHASESAFADRMSYASNYLLARGVQERSLTMRNVEEDDSLVAQHAPQYHRERIVVYIRSIRKLNISKFRIVLRAEKRELNASLADWTTRILLSTGQAK